MTHDDYMRRALKLAGRGRTSPNPKVGAVVVKDDVIVGEGYHRRVGEPHAEVLALRHAGERARDAAVYVTLEPCCHHGRTPPCTDAIIAAEIAKVYAATPDPDPKVASRGFDLLRKAGIEVHCGICEREARELNEAYMKHRATGMPFVILKSAMSLDGKIATRTGDSKWITSERSRAFAHRIRSEVDAIVVGAATVRADNPSLTARLGKRVYYPTRVVVTGSGDLSADLKLLGEEGETVIAAARDADAASLRKLQHAGARILTLESLNGRVSIVDLMRRLADMGNLSVLIEGGGEIAASALEEQVVDKVVYIYAPCIIGGRDAVTPVGGHGASEVSSAISLDRVKVRRFGRDIAIEGYVRYPDTEQPTSLRGGNRRS